MKRRDCLVRQYGDQMICGVCGITWDVSDAEPPPCWQADRRTKAAKATAKLDAETYAPPKPPATLPPEWERELNAAHRNGGMRAVYRTLLDKLGEL